MTSTSDVTGRDSWAIWPLAPWRWALWSEPARVTYSVLTVEFTALMLATLQLIRDGAPSRTDHLVALLLVGAGVLHSEIARGVERVRRRITQANGVDLISVWTFAAALVLPPTYAGIVALTVHTYVWARSWHLRTPFYRHLFSTTTVVLACFAAGATVQAITNGSGLFQSGYAALIVVAALLVYTTVNSCLVAGIIAISAPRVGLSNIFSSWDENLLEIGTLCLGGFAAAAIAINSWMIVLLLPPLLLLHKAALVRQLAEAASTDAKTGLLTAAAWHSRAERAVDELNDGVPYGVLLCDLDFFKAVNDRHGHLAGDQVLGEVGALLRREVREGDLVGRFGGEEFVLFLSGEQRSEAGVTATAEQIRQSIAALQVEIPTPDGPLSIGGFTVSIGGVVADRSRHHSLRDLMAAADIALYAAKTAGRNRIQVITSDAIPYLQARDSAS